MRGARGARGARRACAPPPRAFPPPSRGGHCAEGEQGGGRKEPRRRACAGDRARRAPAAGGAPRPTSEEIAAYHRDANTYFALLAFCGVAKRTDAAPTSAALALQRFLCAIPGGYGDSHPVRTRYENAMPCLSYYTQVKGMPPHNNDAERVARNVSKRYMDAPVQFKSFQDMAVTARKMEIDSNARNSGMPEGRAVTYAVADPEWSIFDGPSVDPPARAGASAPRRRGSDDGGPRLARGPCPHAARRAPRATTLRLKPPPTTMPSFSPVTMSTSTARIAGLCVVASLSG